MALNNYFLTDDNLRIKLNKILNIHPYNTSYPTLSEIAGKLNTIQDAVVLDFSNSNIKNLDGFKDIPWGSLNSDRVELVLSDNPFPSLSMAVIDAIFTISDLARFTVNNIYLPHYIKYYLILKKNEFVGVTLEYDNTLNPVKDQELLGIMNTSIGMDHRHQFISKMTYDLLHKYYDNISAENILDSITNITKKNGDIYFLSGIEYCRRVVTIDLENNFLVNYNNHLTAWSLMYLITLNLSNNPYLKEVPNLENCINVEELYLSNTRFTEVAEISNMSSLRKLDLSDTGVSVVTSISVTNFPSLTFLKLANLGLSSLSATLFTSQDLETLDLSGNGFTIPNFDMPDLVEADFSDNTFSDPTLDVTACPSLRIFKANDTNLTSINFDEYCRVREIHLQNTAVDALSDLQFTMPEIGFDFLEVLDLSGTNITDITSAYVKSYFMKSTAIILTGCDLTMDTQKILKQLVKEGYNIEFDRTKLYDVLTNTVSLR